jgi:hypothetical protein
MPPKIPEDLRWAIVEKWMFGYPRIVISTECHVSTGAVSSIVAEWKHAVGLDLANLIRDIGVTLRKLGMSPAQCATGLRVANLIDRIGLDEDSIEAFLSQVYTSLQESGVNPKHIARYVEGLASLLEGRNDNNIQQTAISLPEIDRIFEKMKRDKIRLEEEFKVWETKIQEIRREVSHVERDIEKSLEEKGRIEMDIGWKSELSDKMKKYELTIDELFKLVDASPFFKDHGFNGEEVVMILSSYKEREGAIASQERLLESLKGRSFEVEKENKFQEELLDERRLKNSELDTLKEMGFGLKELKIFRNLITEFAAENGLSAENKYEIVRRFFSDFENHYDDYLRLREKVSQLEAEKSYIMLTLPLYSRLGEAVSSFIRRGATQNDIKNVIKMIEEYPISAPMPAADSASVTDRDKTDGSMIQRDSTEAPQAKQELDESSLQVESDDVIYFDNNMPPSEI